MMAGDGSGEDYGNANDLAARLASLSDVPISLLRSELSRREKDGGTGDGEQQDDSGSTCGGNMKKGGYNTSLHVAALVLILVLSTLACSFPIIARRFPRLPIPRHFLFLSRHFGTGVLIATAFIHLLPTAFMSLTDPCLPYFWNKGYPAMAGLVAMISVLAVVTIEMFFALRGAKHVHGTEYDTLIHPAGDGSDGNGAAHHNEGVLLGSLRRNSRPERMNLNVPPDHLISAENSPGYPKRPDTEDGQDPYDNDDLDLDELEPFVDEDDQTPLPLHNNNNNHPPSQTPDLKRQQTAQKQLLQCLLLEAGILFHSIFIGMALSVATGTSFLVLLVAISFHQTFEGFALGARIASLIPDLFSPTSPKPWLMALAYGTTTPIGQAIGLGLHNLYDPGSTAGLLMVGITNSVSSGLLLFAGLVELLAEDFLSDRSYEILRGRRRMEACVAVAGGAMLMALVGAWA
ncbi:hypothetical protein FQN54_003176 [Arachnomyces sp. PD_36]|nr:hypothetical protein FQN54_003176 [Arachnomyces sp. PD_36]